MTLCKNTQKKAVSIGNSRKKVIIFCHPYMQGIEAKADYYLHRMQGKAHTVTSAFAACADSSSRCRRITARSSCMEASFFLLSG